MILRKTKKKMGSGASFDSGLGSIENEDHYFCHSCHRVFGIGSLEQPNEFLCPYCSSTFLEQMGRNERNFDVISLRHRTQGQLTLDQARRIANATAMLRLLETQLREELESLQQAFEAASFPAENRNRKGKLTKVMKGRLRNSLLSLDVICNQPSCPICSEDYVVGMEALKLPCSHVFHRDCVMPWLEQKQNCPICRAELSNVVPSIEELDCYSLEEIDERLRDLNVEVLDITTKEKYEFVYFLFDLLTGFT